MHLLIRDYYNPCKCNHPCFSSGNNGLVSGGINHILYLHLWKTINRGPLYCSPLHIPSIILTLKLTSRGHSTNLRKVFSAIHFSSSLFKTFQPSLGLLSCYLPASHSLLPRTSFPGQSYMRNEAYLLSSPLNHIKEYLSALNSSRKRPSII